MKKKILMDTKKKTFNNNITNDKAPIKGLFSFNEN